MDFIERVAAFIQAHQLLEDGQELVAGVSGGPDSVCLLDCLVRLGYRPAPVYIDHALRSESAAEAEFVSHLASGYSLKATVIRIDVPARLEEQGGSLEAEARSARYLALMQVAETLKLDTIATGHQADDQVETVLLHFLRGSGVIGLAGMRPERDLSGWFDSPLGTGKRLIRPLLAVNSAEVLAYLKERSLEFRIDDSNQDLNIRRNRVRNELIPILENYNPAVREALRRMAEIMGWQADWIRSNVQENWDDIVLKESNHQIVVDRARFLGLPAALQTEIVRAILQSPRLAPFEPEYGLIKSAVDFIRSQSLHLALGDALELHRLGERILFARQEAALELPYYPQLTSSEKIPLPVPGEIKLANGWILRSSQEELTGSNRESWLQNPDPLRAALSVEEPVDALSLRPRRKGDRLQPLGMHGMVKLSDLFINEHVPRPARDLWPLVEFGDQIVWVVGLKMAEPFRLQDASRQVVVVAVEPPEDILEPSA